MSEAAELAYVGQELGLFSHARNWKRYWGALLEPYLRDAVLEVGAGLGVNTRALRSDRQRRWVCLEPDERLLEQFRKSLATTPLAGGCELRQGTLGSLDSSEQFDFILYIDVLEHIEDDAGELAAAAAHLKDQGRLGVLSPAHGWLFSEFDAAIGHYRRYDKKSLAAAGARAGALRLERLMYLDSCGLLASLGNRLLLRQAMPTLKQILFWDRVMVPLSRIVDPLFLHRLGKSILGVWAKVPASCGAGSGSGS